MSRKKPTDDDRLRETLRDWDPAKETQGLDSLERARMRRRVLSASVEPVPLRLPVRALAAAAVVILTFALGWGIYDDAVMQPPSTAPAGEAARHVPATGPNDEEQRESRQIQFSTPGGTRVVWTLDPDFEV